MSRGRCCDAVTGCLQRSCAPVKGSKIFLNYTQSFSSFSPCFNASLQIMKGKSTNRPEKNVRICSTKTSNLPSSAAASSAMCRLHNLLINLMAVLNYRFTPVPSHLTMGQGISQCQSLMSGRVALGPVARPCAALHTRLSTRLN
jgi:hypothetical protein